jgi:hypothetical protein
MCKRERHNNAERRRVKRLKQAFSDLRDVLGCGYTKMEILQVALERCKELERQSNSTTAEKDLLESFSDRTQTPSLTDLFCEEFLAQ